MATTDERLKALEDKNAELEKALAKAQPSTLSTAPEHVGPIKESATKEATGR